MAPSDSSSLEHRVLVLAPTGRDAINSEAVLTKAGLSCFLCKDMLEVCGEIEIGCGCVLLTEEALSPQGAQMLSDALSRQPPWSDLPIAVLTRGGPNSPVALRAMEALGNIMILERPVRMSTLTIAIRTALRTRARQYENRKLLAELKDADVRKDHFLAMLAHELRNPLAPIRNAMQVFHLLVPSDVQLHRAREIVDRQVENLTRLVDDLLDVSRITRGKVALHKERLDLATALGRAVESCRPLFDSRAQTFEMQVPEQPVFVNADLLRLAQVVSNLLTNASKYTQEGGHIWLSVEINEAHVLITVGDDGIGVAPEMLDKIFGLFTQVDSSLARSHGGLGIGLTLVRNIVDMHGGRVDATSRGLGLGSEFHVSLPRLNGTVQPEVESDATPIAAPPRRILVIDDNVDAADSLAALLRLLKHEVSVAYEGTTALQTMESFAPEVAVVDIGLPGMDGYELAGRLRASSRAQLLLIALSGYGQREDRQRAHAAGFNHHLTKPADPDELQRLLSDFDRH